MEDIQVTVASAVVVPEAQDAAQPLSPAGSAKRRLSSVSGNEVKRPRLDQENGAAQADDTPAQPAVTDVRSDRRKSGQAEERRRGQRLFGALLGTLSQSSSTLAQKRRVDIEKKQQAKLKLQAEEFDQKRKQRLDELLAVWRHEQRKFDEQSMRIRHSNHLATAHFLQTEAEPKLYYKPWELRPEEEERIKKQIQEAEALIDREVQEFEDGRDEEPSGQGQDVKHTEPQVNGTNGTEETAEAPPNGIADSVNAESDTHPPKPPEATEPVNVGTGEELLSTMDTQEPPPTIQDSKDNMDDSGEVMLEAEEDTVIY